MGDLMGQACVRAWKSQAPRRPCLALIVARGGLYGMHVDEQNSWTGRALEPPGSPARSLLQELLSPACRPAHACLSNLLANWSVQSGSPRSERSAGRSFERPALGRTFASYISVRMGSSSGLSNPVSRPLSAQLVLHRCPVGGAVPVLAADVQSAPDSCRERRDDPEGLLRKRTLFPFKRPILRSRRG